MANNGEARQYSFTMGEISPEKYYTPNEVTYQQGLAKAENVIVKASGGIATRAGTVFDGTLDCGLTATDAQVPHEISFQHPVTKAFHRLTFEQIPITGGHKILIDGIDVMGELKRKNYQGFPTFAGQKIVIPDDVKLSFTMSGEYLVITPALRLYADSFSGYPDLEYFAGDSLSGYYTESVIAIAFSKPFSYAGYYTHNNGMRLIANFGGQLTYPFRGIEPNPLKITASGVGTPPATNSRVSYIVTATRKDGTEEIFLAVRSNDTASSPITSALHIVSTQYVDPASAGALFFPVSPYRTSLKIENIWLFKDLEGLPKVKYFSIYRGVENDPNYTTSFSLVNRFPVYKTSSDTFTINFTDSGESDPSIGPPIDRSFFIQTPSIVELDANVAVSTFSPNKIVSAAFYQSRLFVALNKSENFDNEATTSNTIIASKLNAPEQFALPLITNPAEAFTFQVPEESGGYLTHLAASARLISFTNQSVFVFMGDESGTLSPLVLNPVKVFQVGCKPEVAPCTFGEYTFFAMEGVPSIGFIRITSQGEISYGDALPISRHIFEDKGDEIIAMKILNGPDTSQIRAQILTQRNRLVELTGTDGVFGLSQVIHNPENGIQPVALIENKIPLNYNSLAESVGGVFYRRNFSGTKYLRLPYSNLTVANNSSKLFNPYVDFSVREGFFDSGIGWQPLGASGSLPTANSFFIDANPSSVAYFGSGITDWSQGESLPIEVKFDNSILDSLIPDQYEAVERSFALKLYMIDSDGNEQVITGVLSTVGVGPYTLVFDQEVPVLFRDKFFKIYCSSEQYSNFESPDYKDGVTGLALIAANKLLVPAGYNNGYFEAVAEARNIPVLENAEVPIGLFADGEVVSDLTEDVPSIKAVYLDRGIDGFFWEVDFNGAYYSAINLGVPFRSEVQTLPVEVAVGQGDSISDAGKLISAVSVSVYRTDALLVGEIDQPEEYFTDIDFTDGVNPNKLIKFNGVKEYNFSSSWNKHGMIRLRNKPFRGFSISSIIPKGNVSV